MLTLRGIHFGDVRLASGVKGFFGEGYPFHDLPLLRRWLAPLRQLSVCGGFTSKTTTLAPRPGNLPLGGDPPLTPKERFPRCIKVYPLRGGGMVLNAVGLSGPGAQYLLRCGEWQHRMRPFMISFMAVGGTVAERHQERRDFAALLMAQKACFRAPFGLQENMSCPNVGVRGGDMVDAERALALVRESHEAREIFAPLGIPQQVKLCITTSVDAARRIAEHPECDALAISNAVPFGALPALIPWGRLFDGDEAEDSPLAQFGGGALSGMPIFPATFLWMLEALDCIEKPIEVGGGILDSEQACLCIDSGAAAISLGTVALLRPWRINAIIAAAQDAFQQKKSLALRRV